MGHDRIAGKFGVLIWWSQT